MVRLTFSVIRSRRPSTFLVTFVGADEGVDGASPRGLDVDDGRLGYALDVGDGTFEFHRSESVTLDGDRVVDAAQDSHVAVVVDARRVLRDVPPVFVRRARRLRGGPAASLARAS